MRVSGSWYEWIYGVFHYNGNISSFLKWLIRRSIWFAYFFMIYSSAFHPKFNSCFSKNPEYIPLHGMSFNWLSHHVYQPEPLQRPIHMKQTIYRVLMSDIPRAPRLSVWKVCWQACWIIQYTVQRSSNSFLSSQFSYQNLQTFSPSFRLKQRSAAF